MIMNRIVYKEAKEKPLKRLYEDVFKYEKGLSGLTSGYSYYNDMYIQYCNEKLIETKKEIRKRKMKKIKLNQK